MVKILFMAGMLFLSFQGIAQEDGINANEQKQNIVEVEYEEPDPDAFFIDHKITMGETMIMIARKYMVSPMDIYKYNEAAVHGITSGNVLKIPLHKSAKKDLDGFIKSLEKKNGGQSIQVETPLIIKKDIGEEDEEE